MKQFFTLILVAFSITLGLAQTFSVSPLSEAKQLDGTNEVDIKLTVTNLTADTITLSWERTETKMPDGWTSYICDPAHCLGPSTSSEMFMLLPNATGVFSIHVTPTTTDDYAIVGIKLFPKGNPDQSITGEYTFGQVTGTNDLTVAPIAIYPNPATTFFSLENSQNVTSIEMFNLLGIKVLESTNTTSTDISHLKSGLYFVRLSDKTGSVLATQRLQKN